MHSSNSLLRKSTSLLLALMLVFGMIPTVAYASPPAVIEGMGEQYGSAVPASEDGTVPAQPYTAEASEWFESDGELEYTAEVNSGYGSLTLHTGNGSLEYMPDTRDAGQEVVFTVTAVNYDGSTGVSVVVAVGDMPTSLDKESDIVDLDATYEDDSGKNVPYLPAGSYLNGEVVDSVGGGLCQAATTLYMALLCAELPVTERQNHSNGP